MCGISCIVTLKGTEPQAKKSLSSQLTASLENIQHRGPDSSGRWVSEDGRVALGHVRLSINDLSDAGIQPMHNTDDTVHVVVNGELYDYDGIRESISKKTSYQFRSHSDSELVVALYQYYGLSFISHLRGEFSICLYDSARQLFIAVRDRYGIKPLFWTIHNGRLLIAAEVKAFLPLGWRPEWDVRSLIEGGWSNDQRTLWKGVQKVNPGEYLICRGLEGLENVKYWDIEYPDKYSVETRSEDEMVEGVRSRLLEAVRLRLRADVPVGIYLSGGIDSTVIAGMLAHLLREVKQNGENEHDCNTESLARMSCFTIAFDEDSGFDESSIAKETAASLNVPLHTKHMSEAELARYFSDAVYHTEHHWGELNFVAKFALSELTREKGYKVVLTGEGADEAFGGYRFYVNDYTREPDHSWLPSLQVMPEPDRQSIHRQQEENYRKFLELFGSDNTNRDEGIAFRQTNSSMVSSMSSIFSFDLWAPWTKVLGKLDPRETIANNVDGRVRDKMTSSWHPLHSALYMWAKGHLPNIVLSCLGDRAEMGHSVEARTPFLDHKFTEYVNAVPPSMKIKYISPTQAEKQGGDTTEGEFQEKYILREAARPFIPDRLYRRKKQQSAAPRTYAPGGPLHQLFSELVTEENVARLGFVDWDSAKDLLQSAFEKHEQMAFRRIVMLAEWVVLSQRFDVPPATAE